MGAYGGTSYPTMVFIDADGLVRRAPSGEVPIDVLAPLVDELVAEIRQRSEFGAEALGLGEHVTKWAAERLRRRHGVVVLDLDRDRRRA